MAHEWTKPDGANPPPKSTGRPKGARTRIDYKLCEELAQHMYETNVAGVSNVKAALRILLVENPAKYLDLCAALCPKDIAVDADITVRTIITGVPRKDEAIDALPQPAIEVKPMVMIEPRVPGFYRDLDAKETGARVGLPDAPEPEPVRYPRDWDKQA